MGLDMYLTGKRYISAYGKEDKARSQAIASQFEELAVFDQQDEPVVREVSIRAGYWRKANAIHKWFVDNVQYGEDKCRPFSVDRANLVTLRELCLKVLSNREMAQQLLPSQSGFFFGGTDYDAYYFGDLDATVEIIDRCLALPEDWEFEYQSSW